MFGSNLQTVGWIAVCCVVTCAGALLSTYLQNDSMALISAVSVVAILIATRVFGHVELQLLAGRLKAVGMSLITPAGRGRGHTRQAAIRLQGTRKWDTLWSALTEFADKLNLHSIRLDINLPAVHEGFHGLWRRQHHRNPDDLWRTEIPLFSGDRLVGRLTASGERDGVSSCELIERLMDLLQPFESGFVELARVAAPADAATNGHALPLPVERVITANPGNVA
jgi:UDP-GlcNAc:undecaprenyl-phosphate GlcNAc-1-phosphate transferase